MTRPLLPPRGIFIPTDIIFNPRFSPAILVTWIQVRCLAWGGWVTPALSMQELAAFTGKSQAKLHRHMSQLRRLSALSWRSTGQGTIIVTFADELSKPLKPVKKPPAIQNSQILDPGNTESPYPAYYFPPQILGYLSIQVDEEGFLSISENPESVEDERGIGTKRCGM
jgi:hypothetical protein